MAVHDELGAQVCRILVPGYSEVYAVDDLVWDNTNKALAFREDILNLHRLSNDELLDLLRSEEHTSELQSPDQLVCRLLLEKQKQLNIDYITNTIHRSSKLRQVDKTNTV